MGRVGLGCLSSISQTRRKKLPLLASSSVAAVVVVSASFISSRVAAVDSTSVVVVGLVHGEAGDSTKEVSVDKKQEALRGKGVPTAENAGDESSPMLLPLAIGFTFAGDSSAIVAASTMRAAKEKVCVGTKDKTRTKRQDEK